MAEHLGSLLRLFRCLLCHFSRGGSRRGGRGLRRGGGRGRGGDGGRHGSSFEDFGLLAGLGLPLGKHLLGDLPGKDPPCDDFLHFVQHHVQLLGNLGEHVEILDAGFRIPRGSPIPETKLDGTLFVVVFDLAVHPAAFLPVGAPRRQTAVVVAQCLDLPEVLAQLGSLHNHALSNRTHGILQIVGCKGVDITALLGTHLVCDDRLREVTLAPVRVRLRLHNSRCGRGAVGRGAVGGRRGGAVGHGKDGDAVLLELGLLPLALPLRLCLRLFFVLLALLLCRLLRLLQPLQECGLLEGALFGPLLHLFDDTLGGPAQVGAEEFRQSGDQIHLLPLLRFLVDAGAHDEHCRLEISRGELLGGDLRGLRRRLLLLTLALVPRLTSPALKVGTPVEENVLLPDFDLKLEAHLLARQGRDVTALDVVADRRADLAADGVLLVLDTLHVLPADERRQAGSQLGELRGLLLRLLDVFGHLLDFGGGGAPSLLELETDHNVRGRNAREVSNITRLNVTPAMLRHGDRLLHAHLLLRAARGETSVARFHDNGTHNSGRQGSANNTHVQLPATSRRSERQLRWLPPPLSLRLARLARLTRRPGLPRGTRGTGLGDGVHGGVRTVDDGYTTTRNMSPTGSQLLFLAAHSLEALLFTQHRRCGHVRRDTLGGVVLDLRSRQVSGTGRLLGGLHDNRHPGGELRSGAVSGGRRSLHREAPVPLYALRLLANHTTVVKLPARRHFSLHGPPHFTGRRSEDNTSNTTNTARGGCIRREMGLRLNDGGWLQYRRGRRNWRGGERHRRGTVGGRDGRRRLILTRPLSSSCSLVSRGFHGPPPTRHEKRHFLPCPPLFFQQKKRKSYNKKPGLNTYPFKSLQRQKSTETV
eukprot:Hpha_TRINITY_DN16622_c4_g11::TRINITY_DN16622_c4_g11_i1::g.182007::m.182007